MSRLTVLHLGKYYAPIRGGIETVLETLCRGARGRVDSRALVLGTTPSTVHDIVDGVHVTRVGSFGAVGAVALSVPVRAIVNVRVRALSALVPNGVAETVIFAAGVDKAGAVAMTAARPSEPVTTSSCESDPADAPSATR